MTVKDFYAAIDGDYDEILERLVTEDRIRRFLKKLIETTDMAMLQDAWSKKDVGQIFAYSHRLKGMAQNLSLNRFAEKTSALTEAFRNGPALDMDAATEIYTSVCSEYDTIATYINQIE